MPVPRPEGPEDSLSLLPRDARTAVIDRDPDRPVDLGQGKTNAAAVGRPAESIREQVRDHLQHAVAVGLEDGRGGDRAAVVDPPPARLFAEGRVSAVDQPLQVDFFPHQ